MNILNKILNLFNYKSKVKPEKEPDDDLLEYGELMHQQGFLEGVKACWYNVQICLFDMYRNNEILDFSTMVIAMDDKLKVYADKPETYKKASADYLTALKTTNMLKNGIKIDSNNN